MPFYCSNPRQRKRIFTSKPLHRSTVHRKSKELVASKLKKLQESAHNLIVDDSESDSDVYESPSLHEQCDLSVANEHGDTVELEDGYVSCDEFYYEYDVDDRSLDKLSADEAEDTSCEIVLQQKLATWMHKYAVTRVAMNDLLDVLRPHHHPFLCKDSRSLLPKIAKSSEIKAIMSGQFYYFGLASSVAHHLKDATFENGLETIQLQFNVDGLPLHKSRNTSVWPILCSVKNFKTAPLNKPFMVGVFVGDAKPGDVHEYMHDFMRELIEVGARGVQINGVIFPAQVHSFVCDAPALAFLKCTKNHNGYYSCEKCNVKGEYIAGRVCFLKTNSEERTDNTFAMKRHVGHHRAGTVSPLVEAGVGNEITNCRSC